MFVGIDIGTKVIGWAVKLFDWADSGCVNLGQGSLALRFEKITQWADDFFSHLGTVKLVGIEEPFAGPNQQTTIKLSKAWGIIAGIAILNGFPVIPVAAKSAKKALTGDGNASKEQVLQAAQNYVICDTQDQADAVAIALFTEVASHEPSVSFAKSEFCSQEEMILREIIQYKRTHDGNAPTYRHLVTHTDFAATSTVYYWIEKLESRGLLERKNGKICLVGTTWIPPLFWYVDV